MTVLAASRARIFFDGQYSEPRLHHPEGVAIGPDGAVWCGNAEGDIVRIGRDGVAERVASTGGFILGLAFDGAGHLFACDQRSAAVWRLTLGSGVFERFTPPGIRIPNWPVVDGPRGCLYVSDSFAAEAAGPGVWRYDLDGSGGELWWPAPMHFANGMALAHDGSGLFVVETFGHKVSRIAIGADGRPSGCIDFVTGIEGLPDGIALDDAGDLFISLYTPSRILRARGGRVEVYAEDATDHMFCHPTNIAFDGARLFAANLGRWHITEVATGTTGTPLVERVMRSLG
jgi:sugar lactone lactonase YvrE